MSNYLTAAGYPGQAILLSSTIDVFTLTGSEMTKKGNFFAAMFIVLAAGCLFFYGVLGYATNAIAQVWTHSLLIDMNETIFQC